MSGRLTPERTAITDTPLRLRRDVFDQMMAERGAHTVSEQSRLTGIPERTLYRIFGGSEPSVESIRKILKAAGLSMPAMSALFTQAQDAA